MDVLQGLIYTGLELAQSVELFNETLFQILGIERQLALADTVTVPLYPIALPTPDLLAMRLVRSVSSFVPSIFETAK